MASSQFPQFRSGHAITSALAAGAFIGWMAANSAGVTSQPETVCLPQQITVQEAFSPSQGATPLVVRTIGEAKHSVLVAAYGFTSQAIGQALIAARQRGVDVQVVADEKESHNESAIRDLADGGVPVRLNGHYAIMHNKFIIVDGVTLETGSFNYTHAAEQKNAENVFVIHDQPNLTAAYIRQWHKLWDEAVAVR